MVHWCYMTISTIFIKTCLHWLNLTEKTPKYLKVFKSRFISLLKSFQTVIDSSRLMVTIQYHIILNTFNRQSTRKIQDNFLYARFLKFWHYMWTRLKIRTFLCLAEPDSIFFHWHITCWLAVALSNCIVTTWSLCKNFSSACCWKQTCFLPPNAECNLSVYNFFFLF